MNDATFSPASADLTVLILTLNEEQHIERCLRSALAVARQVFVVDSQSTDRTVALAERHGARVWQHRFTTHAAQLDWALGSLPIDTEWVMRVDADEVISPALAREMIERLAAAAAEVGGFEVSRYVRFNGTTIRHGGYPQRVLRVWRRRAAFSEQRWMDEKIVLRRGRVEQLRGDFLDDNLKSITWWTAKHNDYATREAVDILNGKYRFLGSLPETPGSLTPQARRVRWLKEHVYLSLPCGLRAFLFFLYRMIFRLGIADGARGFAFHFLQGYWYRFLVDVKVRHVERRMREDGLDCVEAIRKELGLDLATLPGSEETVENAT